MTLTEMLEQQSNHRPLTVDIVKDVFKEWLKDIAPGTYQDMMMEAHNIRHDLIIMVDEPGYSEIEVERTGTTVPVLHAMDRDVALSTLVLRIKLMELSIARETLMKAIREDAVIADNQRDVWKNQNAQSEVV